MRAAVEGALWPSAQVEQALARCRLPPTLDSYDPPRSSRLCPNAVDLITKTARSGHKTELPIPHAGADDDIQTGPSVRESLDRCRGMPPEHLVHWHPRG